MSLRITKAGISDAFYDEGRNGYQHLGINPGGVMDVVAMKLANSLVGNHCSEAVLEMHFPAPEILFEEDALVALSGADFTASIGKRTLPVNCPLMVKKGSKLMFRKPIYGSRLYMAIKNGFEIESWLESSSTNELVRAGGFEGRTLKANDVISTRKPLSYKSCLKEGEDVVSLPFSANTEALYNNTLVNILPGPQYEALTPESKLQLINEPFIITNESNRMGYRLQAKALQLTQSINMISSAVTMGTIQLLPTGRIIVLMADHQTTGGYPVIGHVISADLPTIAQYPPGKKISFQLTDIESAEDLLYKQHLHLMQLQNACTFRLKEFL
jgi:antagonist of KipI